VHFEPLQDRAIQGIVEKYLQQLKQRTEAAGIQLQFPEELAKELGGCAKKPDGARQVRRIVEEQVEGPLAVYLLGNNKKTAKIKVIWENGAVQFC